MESRERELFEYRDGKLYWKNPTALRVKVGQEAGSLASDGYLRVKYDYKTRRLHRVIWAYHYGDIEKSTLIDHINRDPLDNRIENLRLCNRSQNRSNSGVSNKLGIKGVSVRGNKFYAQIFKQGTCHYLGTFDTVEEAHAAYLEAAEEAFGEFACGG